MPNSAVLHWIEDELQRLVERNQYRTQRIRESPHVSGLVQVDGRTLIDFSSNDYLGLSANSTLVDAVHSCVSQMGFGSGASPLITGYGVWHRRLEQELARFEDAEAALVFGSGYAANIAVITALVGPGDCIFSDELNHASIIDGCRLSGAKIEVYRHNDLVHLREMIAAAGQFRRTLIATDSLFSMDGDFARLPELVQIAESANAMLMIDEAHATGVFGERGKGVAELMEVAEKILIRVGTLSKALGGIGGFVVGPQVLIDWVRNKARSYIFSTAMPEIAAAVGLAALQLVEQEPQRRITLLEKSKWLREELGRNGIATGNSESQIIPIIVGSSGDALRASSELAESGFLVPAIRPPSVPENSSRLRLSVTSGHSEEQLSDVVLELARIIRILS
ncbi:MAG: 8-amino-7-oxononanoate synthase [Pirellulaceae bacterium]